MNILFISPLSPYASIGGIERYLLNLIKFYQSDTGHNVAIIFPSKKDLESKKEGKICIYYDKNLDTSGMRGNQRKISKKAHGFSENLEKIIAEHKTDIICAENFHLGMPPAYSILLNMVAGYKKIPLILRLHSFAKTELQTEIINQLLWSKISCVSKSLAGDCFHKGADINCLATNYLGVDTDKFNISNNKNTLRKALKIPTGDKIILAASRIVEGKRNILKEKGFICLIQTLSKLTRRIKNIRLLLAIGTPPKLYKNEFEQTYEMLLGYLKLHNVEDFVTVKTFELDEMPGVYSAADIFVLPSENETFGQVYIEAMASGIPVIGTKVGGIPEIISDNHNGYLVHPNDASMLAQRIESIIKDPKLRDKFIENGQKAIKNNFTLKKQFSKFNKMIEKTIESYSGGC